MTLKLIKLDDGTLVEVEVSSQQVQQISGGGKFVRQVKNNLSAIEPLIVRACKSVATAWQNVRQELGQEMSIETAEVELGLNFEIGGDVYIAKSTASSNLKIKLVLKPVEPSPQRSPRTEMGSELDAP
ncbi:MAG: CU044_2847 family protein [Cyanobacteria bacterium P01_G01_bin.54]